MVLVLSNSGKHKPMEYSGSTGPEGHLTSTMRFAMASPTVRTWTR